MKNFLFIIISFVFLIFCSENPLKKMENQSPQIIDISVYPEIIGPNDSVIVIVNAIDPDGDTLVYDWETDSRIHIKGTFDWEFWKYHSFDNQEVFYPVVQNIKAPVDTLWIQCFARDRRGKSVTQYITIFFDHNL